MEDPFMNRLHNEEQRIKKVYAKRGVQKKHAIYSWNCEDVLYTSFRINSSWAKAFLKVGFKDLAQMEVLDVGCGSAAWLRMLTEWGATPARLHGIDLMEDRISKAKFLSPSDIDLRSGSAWSLEIPDSSMDLCAASTVFSSILDKEGRKSLAREMVRVVKSQGWIMIFDYAISDPRNPDTIGINRNEIKKLFPKQGIRKTYYLILAPPILRKIPRNLMWLAHAVEIFLPFLCTHRLYLLNKNKLTPQKV